MLTYAPLFPFLSALVALGGVDVDHELHTCADASPQEAPAVDLAHPQPLLRQDLGLNHLLALAEILPSTYDAPLLYFPLTPLVSPLQPLLSRLHPQCLSLL